MPGTGERHAAKGFPDNLRCAGANNHPSIAAPPPAAASAQGCLELNHGLSRSPCRKEMLRPLGEPLFSTERYGNGPTQSLPGLAHESDHNEREGIWDPRWAVTVLYHAGLMDRTERVGGGSGKARWILMGVC
eukprot:gene11779-biopygen7535